MNAEALVGKELGSYTLRRVIGLGSTGAVYLARKSKTPRGREVVVKVFLHASELEPLQYLDFLLRFRHEMESVASLEHPHILAIDEYEERDRLVYLVMPYVSVRTLESVLNSQNTLPLPQIADYLDQLASAIDYAHEQGVLHLDIKPSNILVPIDDNLLLTDFALSLTMTERQAARIRQFKVGMLDYMAPEQVVGKETGERADLYSLGAVLYHMVTGSAPFQGGTMVEVAKKHLQETPPSPSSKRKDLPPAAERVIQRALAKHPIDRYARASDLAKRFRLAIESPDTEVEQPQSDLWLLASGPSKDLYAYNLFDPQWRADSKPVEHKGSDSAQSHVAVATKQSTGEFVGVQNLPVSAKQEVVTEKISRSLHPVHFNPITPVQDTRVFTQQSTSPSGVLTRPDVDQTTTGTIMKLTSPAKVVNVPVAGRPGRYLVGLMPTPEPIQPANGAQFPPAIQTIGLKSNYKIIALALLVVLLLGTGTLWFTHLLSHSKTPAAVTIVKTPDVKATMTARAIATAEANIIVSDPLSTNIYNWPIMSTSTMIYAFHNNAYHITDDDDTRGAPAILPDITLKGPFVYRLTMEEVKGDDTSINNQFGMIIRATILSKNGKTISTFYSLEVLNKVGGEYQFWKYDSSQGSTAWQKLASHPFGSEFHEGNGPTSTNTFKLIANGKNFTLIVNNKQVWTFQDSSLTSGSVGMLVNLKGTEVAFSNLILTYK